MTRVVVVGAGFGGLKVARSLAGKDVDVLILDQHNYHLFHPLLYQVAAASVEQENIAYPIRAVIRGWKNVGFRLTGVEGLDLDGKRVLTDSGAIGYDHLVLATGSVGNYFGLQKLQKVAHNLESLDDAVALRSHVLTCFERAAKEPNPAVRNALLTFVIVGAGPTGVEFAGALAELVRHGLVKDYPELQVDQARIILLEALDSVLPTFPEGLRPYAHRRLGRLGVEVRLHAKVTGADPGRVLLSGQQEIPTRTLFWAAGVQASPLAEQIPGPKGRGGRVRVRADLSLETYPDVFVIGDMAYVEQEGEALPMVAPVAVQQGAYVARAMLARQAGRSVEPFRYRSRGMMAIIGRNAAVAEAYGIKLRGFVAWLTWLGLHLYYLIGFRNRLFALVNWAYAYLLLDPKLRLITEPPRTAAQGRGHPEGIGSKSTSTAERAE